MQCKLCQKEFEGNGDGDMCPDCAAKLKATALGSSGMLGSSALKAVGEADDADARPKPAGKEIWRSTGSETLRTVWPISVALHPAGDIIVLDEPDEYRLLRLDRNGKCLGVLFEITADSEPGGVEDPQGLVVDAEGKIYIPDAGNDRISVWSEDGQFRQWVGGPGARPGQFAHPLDVDVDVDGFLHVADTFNRRIQKLSADGLVSFVVHELGKWGALAEPVAITIDAEHRVYVADNEQNRVILLSPEGEVLRVLPEPGQPDDLFDSPGDVRVLPDGTLLVSDRGNLRIQRFDAQWQRTGLIDLSRDDDEIAEGGDIAAFGEYVIIPDRFNDCIYCIAFDESEGEG